MDLSLSSPTRDLASEKKIRYLETHSFLVFSTVFEVVYFLVSFPQGSIALYLLLNFSSPQNVNSCCSRGVLGCWIVIASSILSISWDIFRPVSEEDMAVLLTHLWKTVVLFYLGCDTRSWTSLLSSSMEIYNLTFESLLFIIISFNLFYPAQWRIIKRFKSA